MSTTTDTRPPGSTDAPTLPPLEPKPEPVAPDARPSSSSSSRPTTRAGRRAATEARKASSSTKADKAPKSSSSTRRPSLETRLASSLTQLGIVTTAVGAGMGSDPIKHDGLAVVQQAPSIAAALDRVAKDNPAVRDALERAMSVGTWGTLIAALMPLVVAIAANHGAVPAGVAEMLGVTPPADLADATAPAAAP